MTFLRSARTALNSFVHVFFSARLQFFMELRVALEKTKKLQSAREVHDAKVPVLKLQINGVEVRHHSPSKLFNK